MTTNFSLGNYLKKLEFNYYPVLEKKLQNDKMIVFDFSARNTELARTDLSDTANFTDYLFSLMKKNNAVVGIGQYAEDRVIYHRSALFDNSEDSRTIHLGIDLFAPAGTSVFAPLDAAVHSFQNNAAFGDYGPTIILQHNIAGIIFYTLYGHLALESLENVSVGQKITAGQKLAMMGNFPINGDWPPHLHFQVMADMLDKAGDFPGVCRASEKNYWLNLCPDPNLILKLPELAD